MRGEYRFPCDLQKTQGRHPIFPGDRRWGFEPKGCVFSGARGPAPTSDERCAPLPRSPWCAFALGVLPWRGARVRGFLQSRQLPLSLGSPVAAEGGDCQGAGCKSAVSKREKRSLRPTVRGREHFPWGLRIWQALTKLHCRVSSSAVPYYSRGRSSGAQRCRSPLSGEGGLMVT